MSSQVKEVRIKFDDGSMTREAVVTRTTDGRVTLTLGMDTQYNPAYLSPAVASLLAEALTAITMELEP